MAEPRNKERHTVEANTITGFPPIEIHNNPPINSEPDIQGDRNEDEQPDPLVAIMREAVKIAHGASVIELRKVVTAVYPKDSGKEESMRFLAALTRLRQAAEVAFQIGSDIHGSIMNGTR